MCVGRSACLHREMGRETETVGDINLVLRVASMTRLAIFSPDGTPSRLCGIVGSPTTGGGREGGGEEEGVHHHHHHDVCVRAVRAHSWRRRSVSLLPRLPPLAQHSLSPLQMETSNRRQALHHFAARGSLQFRGPAGFLVRFQLTVNFTLNLNPPPPPSTITTTSNHLHHHHYHYHHHHRSPLPCPCSSPSSYSVSENTHTVKTWYIN